LDTDRVWFKAVVGLPGVPQLPSDSGLAASVILDDGPYLVSNARTDRAPQRHPLVTGEPGRSLYAAAPIVTPDGYRLGTVAVMDTEPHEATPEQLELLADLAAG
jgi:sigma-B regulation protein RsbU (phosphoserine phosphatase)